MSALTEQALEKQLRIGFVLTTNYLRFGMISAMLLFALPLGLYYLPGPELYNSTVVGLLLIVLNFAAYLLIGRLTNRPTLNQILTITFLQIVGDIAGITALIHLTGGLLSPMPLLYIFPFLYTGMVFSRGPGAMLAVAGLVNFAYSGLLAAEYFHLLPLPLVHPEVNVLYQRSSLVFSFACFVPLIYWTMGLLGAVAAVTLRRSRLTGQAELSDEIQQLRARLDKKLEETNAELFSKNKELEAAQQSNEEIVARLQETEERFRLIFNLAPQAMYLHDLRGNFIDGNQAAEKLSGFARNDLVGKNYLQIGLLAADQIPRAATILARNIVGLSTGPEEYTLQRRDGRKLEIEISTHPIQLKGQHVVLSLASDISDRKKHEKLLAAHARELEIFNSIIALGYRSKDLRELLSQVLDVICNQLSFSGGGIYLVDQSGDQAEVLVAKRLNESFVAPVRAIKTHAVPYEQIFIRGQQLLVENYPGWQPDRAKLDKVGAIASIPFFVKDKVIGAINLAAKEPRVFSQEERELFTSLGQEVGAIVARLQAEEQLKQRLAELEKVNRFMVNREMDMIAIKREVNGLLKELGRPERYKT
jgi:PAS domain S-box-containing protein